MADVLIPHQWTRLGAEELRGTVMVVGASDTGKTTLARYLFQELCSQGVCAAYLDADLGQSTLGMPTTLTVGLPEAPGDGRFPPAGAMATYFVGATTPRGHMLPTVIGTYRLQQKALALGAQAIIVDTTGLVDEAQGGKALKQWKTELLGPGVVIGLRRGRELEPILWPLRRDGRVRCLELSVSPHVRERSREERIARRRERLSGCFEKAQPHLLNLRQVAVYNLERRAPGALCALQDAEGFALALGVVEEADPLGGMDTVRTPLSCLAQVKSVRFGAVRWDLGHSREL